MIERLVTRARRLDEDLEIGARLLLADEFRQPLRTQRSLREIVLAAFGSYQAGRGGIHNGCSTRRRPTSPTCGGGRRAKLAGRGITNIAISDAPSPTLPHRKSGLPDLRTILRNSGKPEVRRGRERDVATRISCFTSPIPSARAGSAAWSPRPRLRCVRLRRWRQPPAGDHSRD